MYLPRASLLALLLAACGGGGAGNGPDSGGGGGGDDAPGGIDAPKSSSCTGTAVACAATWEQTASDTFDSVVGNPTLLTAFVKAVPKGGDLHNHVSGAVYAETYLGWGSTDGDCVGSASDTAVAKSSCSASNLAIPASGTFFDAIIAAWSMQGFTAGAQNGHDHFFATFAKYGLIAGAHRDDSIADLAKRAADENEVYVETMFNLGKNMGTLTTTAASGMTVTKDNLATIYASVTSNAGFANAVNNDVAVVTSAETGYREVLACDSQGQQAPCDVGVRFVAQIARTGSPALVFGQLIGAFEMAKKSKFIVAADLSSPEDDSSSISNYDLQMQMLAFLHTQYAGNSPLHVTLHAGELSPTYLPQGSIANTYHVRAAVEIAKAERIGHGVDIMSETDPAGLMDEMATTGVSVEVCLSSNAQILGISGTAHPLAQYLAHNVPVTLGTDDQGVSRSSMAGEYARAATDQHLTYRQLKTMARNSIEHSFLPGASLWTTLGTTAVADCAPTATMAIGDPASTGCAAFLATSEKAAMEWTLEHNFLTFESGL